MVAPPILYPVFSTWGDRTAEFAFYLYLIELFKDTLLPASVFGFVTTVAVILFSASIGSLVDRYHRLVFVRWCIVVQKFSAAIAYGCFLAIFSTNLQDVTSLDSRTPSSIWGLFCAVTISGCALRLSTVGISVAVEREWVICIAQDDDALLTRLNTVLRRIDLTSKLLSPLFVSLLTSAASYKFSAAFLLGLSVVTMVFEFICSSSAFFSPDYNADASLIFRDQSRMETTANGCPLNLS